MSHDDLRAALRGVAFTTATPFTDDGRAVDHDALAENLAAMADAGAGLFVPCGNTGEYYALTREERVEVVRTHVEAVGAEATVVAGLGGSTGTALELVDAYEAAGVDGMMVMHPAHTYVHERGLIEYYRRIADAAGTGVVLYKRSHDVSRAAVVEVAAHEDVVGLKYAVDDVDDFAATVAAVGDDLVPLNGIAERYAPAFALEGAEGFTTGIGNFVPGAPLSLFDALRAGDYERARELRELVRPYEELRSEAGPDNDVPAANNVPAVKYGLELAGLHGGPVREPLVELAPEDRERAERYYERVREADL